jgi:hypothetical protein
MQKPVFISPNAQLIECIISPSNGTTQNDNPFGTQMQLLNRKIVAIETFSQQDFTTSPISTSNPVIPDQVFNNAFLTLYTAAIQHHDAKANRDILIRPEGLYYDLLPFAMLRRVGNAQAAGSPGPLTSFSRDLFVMRPTELSWVKCRVKIPTPVTITQTYSAVFLVHYEDPNDLDYDRN